ncbi:thioredoxin family protein [Flaviaesturariibacter amylovorans]|uniref:Thioredoxin domain-containing protein n=1 Tax=Flaviaesturariibacter amylovorans TaxID=1084520 RepID=A0ABP8GAG7_9BACT
MKRLFFALFLFASLGAAAQAEASRDSSGVKILKGFMTKKDLVTDTAFAWWGENLKGFTPNADAVTALRAQKDSIHILAFGGTWCGDTKHILPKVYGTLEAAGLSQERITLLGVDRRKQTVHNLAAAFNVTLVPTFIVLKNGQEVGRIVEYGSMGMPEMEIGQIVGKAAKK